ncbi:SpaA isopeptide-forming pilin-related protein [Georgenia sp. Z1344]|uniref:SpaA isopeptide-forming pilin-related protein n=1 Tax=Georgenia sp. Z1344 TaxID=3416706 RepID=UPI003CFBB467
MVLTPLAVPVVAAPAAAAPDGTDVIINEYYTRGGSTGQPFQQDFVELYNPTDAPVDLSEMSLQYRGRGSGLSHGTHDLSGTIQPGEYYVVAMRGGVDAHGEDLIPSADEYAENTTASYNLGVIALVDTQDTIALPTGSIDTTQHEQIIDLVGTGSVNAYEGTAAAASQGGSTDPRSWHRTDFVDTDDNAADFTMAAPSPGTDAPVVEDPIVSFAINGTDGAAVNGTQWTFTDAEGSAFVVVDGGTADGENVLGDTDPAQGAITVEGLPAGDYTVTDTSSLRAWQRAEAFEATIEGGEQSLEDIVLDLNGIAQVRTHDAAGAYVEGATVRFTTANGTQIDVVDNAEGDHNSLPGVISVEGLPLGASTYEIVAAPEGYEIPADDARSRTFSRSGFSFVDYRAFVLPATPVVPGPLTVSVENMQGDTVGSTGWLFTAEDGTQFYLADNNRSNGGEITTLEDTDSAFGSIVVDGLPAGEYTVTNESAGSSAYRAPAAATVTVDGGEQALVPFVMLGNGRIAAWVTDEADEPIEGVTVRFTHSSGESVEVVDGSEQDLAPAAGTVRAGNLELGDYTVEIIEAEGYDVEAAEALTTTIDSGTSSRFAGGWVLTEIPVVPGPVTFTVADSSDYTISNTVWQFTDAEGETFTVADNNARQADLDDANDANGQASVSGIPAGEYTVENISVASPWRAAEPVSVTITGDEQDLGEFVLPGNGRIAAWVTDEDDAPIEGVTVRFTHADGTSVDVVDGSEADLAPAAGTVRAGNLELGDYTVEIIEAEGYDVEAAEALTTTIDSGAAAVWAGGWVLAEIPGPLSISVLNTLGDTVGSTAWLFTAEDGTQFYVADNNRSNGGEVTTLRDSDNAFGSIVVDGMPAGEYTVTNERHGSSAYRAPEPVTVTVDGGEQSLEPFVMLGNASTTVYLQDEADEYVAGATFRITDADGESRDVVDGGEGDGNDRDGYVEFGQLELGTYTVTMVEAPEGYSFDESQELTVTLTAGAPHRFAGGLRVAEIPGPVSFTVADSSDYAISNTTWQFTDAEDNVFVVADNDARNTDIANLSDSDEANGAFSVMGLPAGEYTVENIGVASPWRASEPFSVTITGDEQDLGELVLPGNGRIAAWVTDEDDAPIEGVTVRFTHADGTSVDVVDGSEADLAPAAGTVRAGGLELGEYTVEIIEAEGYDVEAAEALTTTIDAGTSSRFAGGWVLAEIPGPVSFTVADSSDYAISNTTWQFTDAEDNVFVVADNDARNTDIANLSDSDEANGAFSVMGLPAGEYTVENIGVASPWRASEPFSVTITGDEQDLGEFVLPGNGRVSVYATGPDEEPVAGVTYRFTGSNGDTLDVVEGSEQDTSDAEGTLRVDGLELVTWTVQVVAVPEGFEFDAEETREAVLSAGIPARFAGGFDLTETPVEPEPEPEPVPPTPGRGFYLNDGWDIWADHEFSFGRPGDEVLVGDWDGDGSDTLAVRRGNAYFLSNSLYGGNADIELTFGRSGDTVLVGDWNGDGVDTFAVRRGNSYFLTNRHTGGDAETELDYGRANDQVLVGDYDGDGTDTFAVRRGARYFVSNSLASGWADAEFTYGRAADQVLVGDWDGDGSDTFASRRGNLYLMSNTLTGGWADREVHYGRSGDEVFVGDWNGDGADTLGIRR